MFEKTVIITGGSTDVGKAVARLFVNAGANVVIASKMGSDQTKSDTVVFLETDVKDEAQVKRLIDKTLAKFSKIDIVISGASTNHYNQTDIPNFSLEEYYDIFNTEMAGTFLLTKHTLPHLLKTGGTIINIASQLGMVPDQKFPIFCASKAAMIMFTKAMAGRYAADGIRINCVCPGPIDSLFLQKNFPIEKLPMGRLGTPEEVANIIFFLASEKCSFVTGAAYTVDGGSSISRGHVQKHDLF